MSDFLRRNWRAVLAIIAVLVIALAGVWAVKAVFFPKPAIPDDVQDQIHGLRQEIQRLQDLTQEIQRRADTARGEGRTYAQGLVGAPDREFLDAVNDWSDRMVRYSTENSFDG
jgi:hypothetical protein